MSITVLNVAEKPSVAKQVSAILSKGHSRSRPGYSKHNPVYEFEYDIDNQRCDMVVTSVLGHLMEAEFPQEYQGFNACDPVLLFDAPVTKFVPEKHQPLEKTLQREARGAKWLILWLDCDREGENIAFEVVSVCTQVNPRLRILRAHFSSLVPREIHAALRMNKLTPPDENLSKAVDARLELDLRIGYAFTRFQTLRFKRRFVELSQEKQSISYGPCQFPTLGFVVDRYWKRKAFKPEPFWYIDVKIEKVDEKGALQTVDLSWERGHLFDKSAAAILAELVYQSPLLTLYKMDAKEVLKYRPFPLTTVELQKRAAKSLRVSAHEAMQVAEALYNKGYISYPRTETDVFPQGFDFTTLIEQQCNHAQWGDYARGLLERDGFQYPKAGKHNDQSHPPIHPTKFATEFKSDLERKMYEFIVRHYLACCSRDAKGDETVLHFICEGGGGEEFRATGLQIREMNFLEIYPFIKWADKTLPPFREGEQIMPKVVDLSQGTTSAPALLTEAELIKLMDQHGIGTDATIAEHIHKILERNYAQKKGQLGEFEPTQLGEALVAGYNFIGQRQLNQPALRAKMEHEMKLIGSGDRTKEAVLASAVQEYKAIFQFVTLHADKLDKALSRYFTDAHGAGAAVNEQAGFSTCGYCQSGMALRETQVGDSNLVCDTCNSSYRLPRGTYVPLQHVCPLCSFTAVQVTSSQQKQYNVCPYCYNNPPNNATGDIEDLSKGLKPTMPCFMCSADCEFAGKRGGGRVRACPACRADMDLKRKKDGSGYFVGCTGFQKGCKKAMWLPWDAVTMESYRVLPTTCNKCPGKLKLLQIKHTARAVHQDGLHETLNVCIGGCDPDFRQKLSESNRNYATWETDAVQPNFAASNRGQAFPAPAAAPRRSFSNSFGDNGNFGGFGRGSSYRGGAGGSNTSGYGDDGDDEAPRGYGRGRGRGWKGSGGFSSYGSNNDYGGTGGGKGRGSYGNYEGGGGYKKRGGAKRSYSKTRRGSSTSSYSKRRKRGGDGDGDGGGGYDGGGDWGGDQDY